MNEAIAAMPAWMSIIPPLFAIVIALIFREVITALVLGILSGTLIYAYYTTGTIAGGVLMPLDLILESVTPADGGKDHVSVIIFSMLIGGMASVITANGSMKSMVEKLAGRATTKKKGLLLTWLMGILIFFDDYANTMVVGNTMRPLTDRLKISREKLAYIVDSTAAPVAAIALVTTWIGAEINFIEDGVSQLKSFPFESSSYGMFLSSLKFSFYPILTLLFIVMLILTGKDYGEMYRVEANMHSVNAAEPDKQKPSSIWRGLIPVLIILFGTVFFLFYTGFDIALWHDDSISFSKKLSLIIGNADSFKALLWSSAISLVFAILASIKIIGLNGGMESMMDGFKKMLPAILILVLAWSLASLTELMGTAEYISNSITGSVKPQWLPGLTFLVSAFIAFATGSSWGTMAILYPVLIGLSWNLGLDAGLALDANYDILLNVISTVLAGSVLGDHCSPISDTTILSSLATECNHISHVKTQMPYALTVGAVSLLFGTVLSAWAVPVWICFIISALVLFGIVSYFGKFTT